MGEMEFIIIIKQWPSFLGVCVWFHADRHLPIIPWTTVKAGMKQVERGIHTKQTGYSSLQHDRGAKVVILRFLSLCSIPNRRDAPGINKWLISLSLNRPPFTTLRLFPRWWGERERSLCHCKQTKNITSLRTRETRLVCDLQSPGELLCISSVRRGAKKTRLFFWEGEKWNFPAVVWKNVL